LAAERRGELLKSMRQDPVEPTRIEADSAVVSASIDLSAPRECAMHLLTRRIGQSFIVNGVRITVKAIRGNRVRLCFDPPEGVLVSRGEIIEELSTAAEQALAGTTGRAPPQAEG
jgi:carbon storage regulator CsrA